VGARWERCKRRSAGWTRNVLNGRGRKLIPLGDGRRSGCTSGTVEMLDVEAIKKRNPEDWHSIRDMSYSKRSRHNPHNPLRTTTSQNSHPGA